MEATEREGNIFQYRCQMIPRLLFISLLNTYNCRSGNISCDRNFTLSHDMLVNMLYILTQWFLVILIEAYIKTCASYDSTNGLVRISLKTTQTFDKYF